MGAAHGHSLQVNNGDVTGSNPIGDILHHDFWYEAGVFGRGEGKELGVADHDGWR